MILGLGTDVVNIERFDRLIGKYGSRLAEKILCGDEIEQYNKVRDKAAFLSKRFAAKESVVKAMGTGFRNGIVKKDINIVHDELGKPVVKVQGEVKSRLDSLGVNSVWISISDDSGYAVATVILER